MRQLASHLARAALPLIVVSLQAGCRGPAPSLAPAAEPAPASREGFVDAGGDVRLFYRVLGAGGDSVVVVHGGPGFTMDYFVDDLAPLAARHTLIFYDQRGTGRSTLVSDSAALDGQRFADDLEAVRRHFGLQRPTVLGHSWGAGVAALWAARHPDRVGRLLIVGGIPLQRAPLLRAFQAMDAGRDSAERRRMQQWREARAADPADAVACRAYYALWFRPFVGDTAALRRSRGDFCAGSPESLRNKMASVDRFVFPSLGDWDWAPPLRAVTAPTLVIHGTVDPLPMEGARGWAATIPGARLLVLDGIGHFPYLEAPERFAAAVDTFLRGGWPDGARTVAAP